MTPRIIKSYADRIETELKQNILPFWIQHAVDREHGTFFGSLTNELSIDRSAIRGALLTTRILWTYSAAYRIYGDAAYLEMAHFAYSDLMKRFWDGQFGGFLWSVAADGTSLQDRKQVYGQAFGIYALTEYYRITGSQEAIDRATSVFHLIESHARDPESGGYLEAFSRQWGHIDDMRLGADDMNEPKSQNTHLHVMEAYTNLLRVWPNGEVRKSQSHLIDVMVNRILRKETGHLQLFFARDWTSKSKSISYGHDIEASWLMMEAADVLGDRALTAQLTPLMLKVAEVTLAEGVDVDGALYNEGDAGGITNSNKEWWPQAEAVVGFINAFQLSDDERYLNAAFKCWDFIENRLIDGKHGEWFRGVNREGAVLSGELKVGFWKCPYHNGRACFESVSRLRSLKINS
jgi:mannobiose 2-epimerase